MTKLAPLAVLLAALPALAQTSTPRVWVVNEASRSISVLDTTSDQVVATIPIHDPDADGSPDTPAAVAFSTVPGTGGTFAFVAQDELITVLDANANAVVRVHDVQALLSLGDIAIRALASSPPRSFQAGSFRVTRTYLHLLVERQADAYFVVLDQERLLPGSTLSPLVGSGLLRAGSTPAGVTVLETASGSLRVRVLYTLSEGPVSGSDLFAVLVGKPDVLTAPWTVQETTQIAVPAGLFPPEAFSIGAPAGGGQLPVLPEGGLGTLLNLDTGGTCGGVGNADAVSVTGPGADSYTVLSLDASGSKLVVVDPTSCATVSFATGRGPSDIATLGTIRWRAAYVANRESDSVTKLTPAGTLTQIPLRTGGGACQLCPIAVGVPFQASCAVEGLVAAKVDEDGDTVKDDLELSWDACLGAGSYEVHCQCVDQSLDCPCACDCLDPAPGCECGGLVLEPFSHASFGGDLPFLQVPPWTPQKNPWKVLGVTAGTSFLVEDVTGFPGVVYDVTPVDPP
jgi:YVTN family beta-propeller protein